jgi:KUP system potassium uptake protein
MTQISTAALAAAPARRTSTVTLAFSALGVVYGDIGTSPLYALKETFAGAHPLPIDRLHVFGALSLVFWALVLVVCVKYLTVVMRADNKGEGGALVLLGLVERAITGRANLVAAMGLVGIVGAALFYGDSMLTPAISVLSAVEGLKVASPAFESLVIPVTIVILLVLFAIQKHGTAVLGGLFGPVILLWFAALAVLGLRSIAQSPEILWALSPHHAAVFIVNDPWLAFLALGSIFLAVTGAEALYADMGHFGRLPIRIAWYLAAMPALTLNYFGQGAALLADPSVIENPFFRIAPSWAVMPMVVLATCATIIASQAVISGAFSMTQQAMQLGYVPRMRLTHTSGRERGQIYIPFINWTLLVFVIALVLGFQSSSNLAAAYGVALSALMVLTTVQVIIVMMLVWKWKRLAWLFGGLFLLVDAAFFLANATKIADGGWFPLVVAAAILALLVTWKRGRRAMAAQQTRNMTMEELLAALPRNVARVPRTAVFLTASTRGVPPALLHNLKHNMVLHERNILLTVAVEDLPSVPADSRVEATDLGHGFRRIVLRYGFMDLIDVPKALANAKLDELGFVYEPMSISYFLSRETLAAGEKSALPGWSRRLFFWMHRSATGALEFFQLPKNRVVELGSQVEI